MSGQRARSAIPADHRSAHPNIPGVPWWGAVLIAVVASTIGFAFDAGSGNKELTTVFAVLYAIGCVVAVLAVRQSSVFTAVIQPPLLLFVVVPGAYYLMHGDDIQGVKDILINCGYPLIQRFPLMFFTSAAVLLLGLARWYFGKTARADAPAAAEGTPATGGRLSAKLSSLLGGDVEADPADRESRRRHSVDRRPSGAPKPATGRAARSGRPVKRADAAPRSRHARPPETEIIEPVVDVDRPRRRRPQPSEPPPESAVEPRRRPRSSSGRERRDAVPPSERRAPYDRAERREREYPPRPQRRRYDGWSGSAERDDYEPLEPHRPPGSGSHHPISRVRYRGADEADDRTEYRTRRRPPRDANADRWEYDI